MRTQVNKEERRTRRAERAARRLAQVVRSARDFSERCRARADALGGTVENVRFTVERQLWELGPKRRVE